MATEDPGDIADTSELDDAFDAMPAIHNSASNPDNLKRPPSTPSSTTSSSSSSSSTGFHPTIHPTSSPANAGTNGKQHIQFDALSPLPSFTPFSPTDPNFVQAPPTAVTAAVYSDTSLLQNEINQLKKQVAEARTREHQLDEENQNLQQQSRQLKTLQDNNELLSKRIHDLEKSLAASQAATEEVRNAAPRSADANVSALQDQVAELRRKLTQRENEIAEVRAKYEDVLAKQDKLESDLLFHKKRYEHTSTRLAKEHELETNALKASFAEVSEKRKQAFLQLKEKLKQAGVIVNKQTASIKDHQARLAEANKTIAELKQTLAQREAEEAKEKHERAEAEQLLAKERGNFELQSSIQERDANEYKRKADQLQDQLNKALMQLELIEQKENASSRYACNIANEGGTCETGQSYKVKSGLPSDSRIRYQWYRSFRGSHFVPITGSLAQAQTYVATVDDIGATLKGECTTSSGITVSSEIGPILPARTLVASIADILKKMDVSFPIESPSEPGVKGKLIQLNKEKIKLRNANKTIHKAVYSDHVKVTLDGDNATKFNIQLDEKKLVLSYSVPTPKDRDLVILTIRTVNAHQLQKEREKLNKAEKPNESLIALAYQIRTQNEAIAGSEAEVTHRHSRNSRPSISISATPTPHHGHAPSESIDLFGGMLQATTTPTATGPATSRSKNKSAGDDIIDKILSSSKPEKEAPVFDFGTGLMTASPASLPPSSGSVAPVPIPSSLGNTASPPSQRGNKPPPINYGNKKADETHVRKGSDSISISINANTNERKSNAKKQEPEVDAEGYIIQPRRGFDDYGTKDNFDSDDEDGTGNVDEPTGPAIKVVINKESKPIATAEALREQMAGLAMAPKKKKGEKEKKKKKKKDSMSDSVELSQNSASTSQQQQPPPITSQPSVASTSSPTSLQIHPQASPSSTLDEKSSLDDLLSPTSPHKPPSASTSTSASATLDPTLVEAANAPLEMLGTPTNTSTPSKPLNQPSKAAPTSASPMQVPTIHTSSPSSSSAIIPTPSPTASPSASGAIDINITETMHARIQNGKVTEFAVLGEINLSISPPPSKDTTYDLSLSHLDMIKLTPNSQIVTVTPTGIYSINIPKGATSLVMGKYKVLTDLEKAKSLVPIAVTIAWTIIEGQTLIDIHYNVTHRTLTEVKFGLALSPDKSIKACTLATPKCMFSPSAQKMLWQFPALPENGGATSGQLHAELATETPTTATPLNVSFVDPSSDALISGIRVDTSGKSSFATQRTQYRMKSGIFTVQ